MTDANSRFDRVSQRARAIATVTLLEHAASLLVAASNEQPRGMDLDRDMKCARSAIRAMQRQLLPVADSPDSGEVKS
jgi:hypothetical protein